MSNFNFEYCAEIAMIAHLTTIERKLTQAFPRSRIDYNKLQNKQFQVRGEYGANSAAVS